MTFIHFVVQFSIGNKYLFLNLFDMDLGRLNKSNNKYIDRVALKMILANHPFLQSQLTEVLAMYTIF